MKHTFLTALAIAVLTVSASFTFAADNEGYGSNAYDDEVVVTPSQDEATPSSDNNVKCCWRWRWCHNYYYTPIYYYYVPRYRVRTVHYHYHASYVCFYKSMSAKSMTNDTGVMIEETPQIGTPLAAHNIVAGDLITHIDGKEVTSPQQLESINANSKLVVLKVNGGQNPAGTVTPVAPAVEYGANEY